MDDSFGARLRRQRERQAISLTSIAEKTKINVSLLEALERGDLSRWPKGIFRRSYLRDYARAIGLDPDATASAILKRFPDAADDVPAMLEAHASVVAMTRRPPTRLRLLLDSAIAVLPSRRGQPPSADGVRDEAGAGPLTEEFDVAPEGPILDLQPAVSTSPVPCIGHDPFEQESTSSQLPADGGPTLCSEQAARHPVPEDAAAPEREMVAPAAPHDAIQLPAVSLSMLAQACTSLARCEDAQQLAPALEDAANALGAKGLTLWMWTPEVGALLPVIACGYSQRVVALMTAVRPDTDTAIAVAFRSGDIRTVDGRGQRTGAVVVPLPAATGAAGVIAFELTHGREHSADVRAAAAIVAAQVGTVVGAPACHQDNPRLTSGGDAAENGMTVLEAISA